MVFIIFIFILIFIHIVFLMVFFKQILSLLNDIMNFLLNSPCWRNLWLFTWACSVILLGPSICTKYIMRVFCEYNFYLAVYKTTKHEKTVVSWLLQKTYKQLRYLIFYYSLCRENLLQIENSCIFYYLENLLQKVFNWSS